MNKVEDKEKSPYEINSKEIKNIRQACLQHAEDLLLSAQSVLGIDKPNIAYHLAALSLEEIGKAGIMQVAYSISDTEKRASWIKNNAEDHVKKLFWAFFGKGLDSEVITKDSIESQQNLAKQIHENRLKGLYVDHEGEVASPRDSIPKDKAEILISLVDARLNIEKLVKLKEPSEIDHGLMQWFMDATNDEDKLKLIVGQKSLDKWSELGSTHEWIKWLKEVFDKNAEENTKLVLEEMNRDRPSGDESYEDKWKITVRIYSATHSIKPKAFNEWNDNSTTIKLKPVSGKKNKNVLDMDIYLPKLLKAGDAWWNGYHIARENL